MTDADRADAERYVRDWLGSYVAGGGAPTGRILRAYADGTGDLEGRVFRAAALSHVTETDDLHRTSATHPGCVVVPAAYLSALERERGAHAVLAAVLAGYEVMTRVGESLGPGHYRTFHNTATAGVFGAAAAAASILELDEDGWVHALGSAGTQAAGLWQFGPEAAMSKPLHAGHAAAAGVRSALLARHGFTGAERILEGEKGFYRGLCPDPEPDAVLRPSDGWKLPETSMKPYPCCRHTHPVIDAALDVRRRLEAEGRDPADVRDVRVGSYATAIRITDEASPDSPHAARFSLQYCAAVTLLDGAPGLDAFEPERAARADVRRLLEKVAVEEDPELERLYPERWGGAVRLRTDDDVRHESRRASALGDPERPLADDDLDRKVTGLLSAGGVEGPEAAALLERCRALPSGADLFPLPGPAPGKEGGGRGSTEGDRGTRP